MNYSAFSTYSCIRYEFFQVGKIIGGGGAKRYVPPPPQYFHWGGGPLPPRIDASAEGGGGGVGGGCPPPTVGSFFIFRLENVQSGAYLRRKFRLDDTNINKSLVWK